MRGRILKSFQACGERQAGVLHLVLHVFVHATVQPTVLRSQLCSPLCRSLGSPAFIAVRILEFVYFFLCKMMPTSQHSIGYDALRAACIQLFGVYIRLGQCVGSWAARRMIRLNRETLLR